ncbi:MAG: Smr/MutS family protein [Proteobacteria bacterium]|nr:Smr/MutS family protein [Pseudomonadota bacterium]MBU1387842.1 Smr/MutS family protein [Pseudomonadota bacterium]MBU1543219.1 Smr/MutS family protein [Pseudomonadota bacterium]MBU2429057.1 Smr/MutS family protein [Pseudomonadota bacterium]MBU2482452.1 Smr/MutS family protein [Pseudomonadota bacterium]
MTKEIKKKKRLQKSTKNGLPILDADRDYLTVFQKSQQPQLQNELTASPEKKESKNKHGVPFLATGLSHCSISDDLPEPDDEDFETLLVQYDQKREIKPLKKADPVPLKKRLKRYPPVEVELDLHGLSSIVARIKLKSFLLTCKNQGIFTARVIVGKGLHSNEGPVLPGIVEDLLGQLKAQELVLSYEWDKKKKLKSGAVIVYLKQFD